MRAAIEIFDDFLPDPEEFLQRTRALRFHRSNLIPGNLASDRVPWAGRLERRFEKMIGCSVKWATHLGSGTYRWTTGRQAATRKTEFYCHSDGIHDVVCLLYLSPPKHCHGGTGLYRHRETGLTGYDNLEPVQKIVDRTGQTVLELDTEILKDAYNPAAWEMTDLIGMRSNRLLMYNSRRFHSHIFAFDQVPKGAKRWTFACFGQSDA